MKQTSSAKNKERINAIKLYQDKQRNISGWLNVTIYILHNTYSTDSQIQHIQMWVSSTGNWKINVILLYTDDLKLTGRNEEELRNEIRIAKTIGNNIKVEFGLENVSRVSSKSGKVHRKQHTGNKMENEIKELVSETK